jgi:hypothetical protein
MLCEGLLAAYVELVERVVSQKIGTGVSSPLAWTELERLMFGISTFDEILDEALPLVLATTKGNGALYAHELNACIIRCINRHNIIFFHGTTSFCEHELRGSLNELLVRVLISASRSHYHALLDENFERLVAWDGYEWLACPRELVWDYILAVVRVGEAYQLHEDLVFEIVGLLGLLSLSHWDVRSKFVAQQAG